MRFGNKKEAFKWWFMLFCVSLTGLFLGILFHEAYHYGFGIETEFCIGTKPGLERDMDSGPFGIFGLPFMYVYNRAPSEHFSHNEFVAYGVTVVTTLSFMVVAFKLGVI